MRTLVILPKLQRTSTADQVVHLLRRQILGGEFLPGTALPEIPLATSLGVSRNTFREAMRTLAAEGLIRRSVHRGLTVADLADEDVVEIFRIRRMLELAAADVAQGSTAEEFAPLYQSVENLRRAIVAGDWPAIVEHDLTFHRALISFLGSSRLEHFYWMLLSELRLGFASLDRSGGKPIQLIPAQHEKLLNCLIHREQAQARKILNEHLDDSEARLRALLKSRLKQKK